MKKMAPRTAWQWAFFLLSILFFFLSYNMGRHASPEDDFGIYWQAGRNFLSGAPVYTPGLDDGGFVYPPFAAGLYGLLSLLPFTAAAIVSCFAVNYLLWVASFYLVRRIFRSAGLPALRAGLLVTAIACSARYYWHNFSWMQGNLPAFCATLGGILCYYKKQYTQAYACFLFGCFFKVTPVLFLVFIAAGKNYRHWRNMLLLSLPFIFLPFLVRGFQRSLQDWIDYYQAFFAPFAHGKTDNNIISLGLPSLLRKLNTGDAAYGIPALTHWSAPTLHLLTLALQLVLFGAVCLRVFRRYFIWKQPLTPADFSLLFLLTVLLPGRVWEHHHVCLAFVIPVVLLQLQQSGKRTLLYGITGLALLTGIIGKDTVGAQVYAWSQHFCLVTVLVLFLFVYLLCSRPNFNLAETGNKPQMHVL